MLRAHAVGMAWEQGLGERVRAAISSSSFASLAQVHFFNSFFYDKLRTKGYDGVKRWTKNVSYESPLLCPARP